VILANLHTYQRLINHFVCYFLPGTKQVDGCEEQFLQKEGCVTAKPIRAQSPNATMADTVGEYN